MEVHLRRRDSNRFELLVISVLTKVRSLDEDFTEAVNTLLNLTTNVPKYEKAATKGEIFKGLQVSYELTKDGCRACLEWIQLC